MQKLILTIAITFWLVSCRNNSQVKTFHGGVDGLWTVKFNGSQSMSYSFTVLENSLNDTCKLGIITIPPGKKGTIGRSDRYSGADTLAITFHTYKANAGAITIKFDD
jgi:uncharacterized lipoprotein NlpE involved in copper resistance